MSQSLYTAMSGISAATTNLQVISNNIANINTTAYKASSVEFSDVFYQTISSGSVATESTGGTNPVQVGVGTQVSAVRKDFSTGSWVATGSDTDLMIQGSGFFCVQSSDTSTFYTRDGSFTFDSGGNLVTADGYKVEGTSSIMANTASGYTVQVPLSICADVTGTSSATLSLETLSSLNGLTKNITSGSFNVTVTGSNGLSYTGTVDLSSITSATTVGALETLMQTGLNFTDSSGNTVNGIGLSLVNGKVQIDTSNATVENSVGTTLGYVTSMSFSTVGVPDATNLLTATGLSEAAINVAGTTTLTAGDFDLTVRIAGTDYTGTVTALSGITASTKPSEVVALLNGTNGLNFTVAGPPSHTISGITATLVNGVIEIDASNAVVDGGTTTASSITYTAGTSNFVGETIHTAGSLTSATSAAHMSYSTNTLDYTVNISELTSASESISATAETINADGSIQVTYDDGSVLSVQLSSDGSNYEFVYTTSDSVAISGSKCTVATDVARPANFVIQLATITNTDGLISVGSNMFEAGPNSGDIIYTVGGHMGTGKLESGGYEASNVDLSEELSNMILAQRAIEANSRVFTTTSDVMSTIVQMGR